MTPSPPVSPSPQEIFERKATKHGRGQVFPRHLWSPENVSWFSRTEALAAELIAEFEGARRLSTKTHYFLVENRGFSAFSFVEGDEFVAITSGAINRLFHLFNAMLSSPAVLSEVGVATKEREGRSPPVGLDLDLPDEITLPRDSTRQLYADRCAMLAIECLLRHELAHIFEGHSELRGLRGQSLSVRQRQAIELLADTDACVKCLRRELERARPAAIVDRHALHPPSAWKESAVSLFLFSTYVLFRSLDAKTDPASWAQQIATGSHPPPPVRLLTQHNKVHNIVKAQNNRWLGAWWRHTLPANMEHAEVAIARVGGKASLDVTGADMALSDAGIKHQRKVTQKTSGLLKDLEPFVRIKQRPKSYSAIGQLLSSR